MLVSTTSSTHTPWGDASEPRQLRLYTHTSGRSVVITHGSGLCKEEGKYRPRVEGCMETPKTMKARLLHGGVVAQQQAGRHRKQSFVGGDAGGCMQAPATPRHLLRNELWWWWWCGCCCVALASGVPEAGVAGRAAVPTAKALWSRTVVDACGSWWGLAIPANNCRVQCCGLC